MDYQPQFYAHKVAAPLSADYKPLWYGYVDESGDPAPYSAQPLVLAAVLTQHPRELELIVRRASRKIGLKSRGGELKSSALDNDTLYQILKAVGQLPIAILAVEVDKSVIARPPDDQELIYATAFVELTRSCLSQHLHLELCVDKRYNNLKRRIWLERFVRGSLIDMQGVSLLLTQQDSTICKPLQVADFVAWSIGKYARGDPSFWDLLKEKVISHEVLRRKFWK